MGVALEIILAFEVEVLFAHRCWCVSEIATERSFNVYHELAIACPRTGLSEWISEVANGDALSVWTRKHRMFSTRL